MSTIARALLEGNSRRSAIARSRVVREIVLHVPLVDRDLFLSPANPLALYNAIQYLSVRSPTNFLIPFGNSQHVFNISEQRALLTGRSKLRQTSGAMTAKRASARSVDLSFLFLDDLVTAVPPLHRHR